MADPDYFTIEEFQALPDCAGFEAEKIEAAAAYFVEIVEREVNASMIERTFQETFDGAYMSRLFLSQPHVRTVVSVTVDGVPVDLDDLSYNAGGTLRYLDGATRWSNSGLDNVAVTYTAGKYETCPGDLKDAVMWATRDRLLNQASENGVDVRKTGMTTELGGTITYVLPGENRPTGYPDLDAVIASRRRGARPLLA